MTGSWRATAGRFVQAVLNNGQVYDPPFPGTVPRRRTDAVVRSAQIWNARLRRRYPAYPPEFKRHARSWRSELAAPGPSGRSPRARPPIFGLVGVWEEEDVIWATVRNLFVQGVDGVFVMDDESSDGTCEEARAAGATVLRESNSTRFEEPLDFRNERMKSVIAEQTELHGGDVWWTLVDADEFPRGPGGATIRSLVGELQPWVDVVGSRVLEHVPGSTSSYRPRTHPASSIPLARWYNVPYCPRGHWKHQLFRVRAAGDVFPMRGCHTVGAGDGRRVREAGVSLLMHHTPLRDRETTRAKLEGAVGGRYAATSPRVRRRLANRLAVLDDLYTDRFDRVPNHLFPGEPRRGLVLHDWRELVPAPERTLPSLEPGSGV